MAEQKIGTVFVELDLDPSRYTKGQQQLLKDATTTTLNIEENFKKLGIKSSAEMDLMRQKIQNSYDMIANSSKATANDIIRAEQAKNDQLNRLNEQQFGKQKTFLSDAKENWKAYTASIIAAGYAAKEMIDASLKMEQITSSLKAVTGSSQGAAVAFDYVRSESQRLGLNLESTGLAYAKFAAATKNTTLEGEGARKVFSGVSEAVTALKLSGESANGIFLALSQMMSKGKISAEELSGQLGERLPGAVKLTADAMGLTTQELLKQMQEGKLMSADVLPKLAEQLHKTYGSAAVEAAEGGQAAINRMNNAMFETKATVGDAIMPVFADMAQGISLLAPYITAFVGGLKMSAVELFGFVDKASTIAVSIFSGAIFGSGGFDKLKKDLSNIDAAVADSKKQIYKDIDKVATAQEKAGEANLQMMKAQAAASKSTSNAITAEEKKAATARETATKQLTEAIRKANVDIDQINKTTFEKEMVRINAEEQEWLKKTQNDVLVAEWKSGQIILANQKQEDETFKMWRKAAEDAEAAMKAEAELGIKMTDEIIKRCDERRKAEIEIYKDLRGYETENYNATLELIKKKETDLRALGVSEIAIAAWVAEETRKAELKKAEYSDSFFDGVKAGLEDIAAKQTSWGKVGIDTVKSFSDNASKTMGSVFFDAYKGQLKSATEYFTAFGDAIVKTFTDALAKMIVEAALSKITMSFNATWTEGAGAVLGAVGKVLGYAADWFFGDMVPDAGQAYGGLIGGLNPGADSYAYDTVPAMLSPGEYVMPRSAVNQETVGALEYMRQTGQRPRGYYIGGIVGGLVVPPVVVPPVEPPPPPPPPPPIPTQGTTPGQGPSAREMAIRALYDANPELWAMLDSTWNCYGDFGVDPAVGSGGYMVNTAPERMLQDPTAFGLMAASENWLYGKRINGAQSVFEYLLDYGTLKHLQKYWSSAQAPDNNGWTYTTFLLNRLTNKIGYGHEYGYNLKGNEARNDWFPWVHGGLMAASAAVATYGAGLAGAAIGSGLFGTGASIAGVTAAQIGGAVGGSLGASSFNAFQQVGTDAPFNWATMAMSAASGAFSGALIGSSNLFTQGGQAARELTANTAGNAAYHDALASGLSREAAEIAYINAYNASLANATAEIIQDMGISALTSVGKKYAISWLLGLVMGKPQSGTLGIGFEGVSGGEGLAASIKNFPGSIGGSFGFPAKNGLDYVPRDNFMIRAHEGEAVLTKEENKRRRNGGNVLHFHFPKALVVDRKAVNELAGLIYPRLEKMAAWGH
jgi:tape measure domain-containing protein